jgi:hypothetical protein
MISQMYPFEKKDTMDGDWEAIDEDIMITELYRYAHRVTPMIKQMLQGEVVVTGHGIYRIKTGG